MEMVFIDSYLGCCIMNLLFQLSVSFFLLFKLKNVKNITEFMLFQAGMRRNICTVCGFEYNITPQINPPPSLNVEIMYTGSLRKNS